jgi:hypothetical protein
MSTANCVTGKESKSAQWITLRKRLESLGFADTLTPDASIECLHDHQLIGTGAVFYQSTGLLQCDHCKGWQLIRKPIS